MCNPILITEDMNPYERIPRILAAAVCSVVSSTISIDFKYKQCEIIKREKFLVKINYVIFNNQYVTKIKF